MSGVLLWLACVVLIVAEGALLQSFGVDAASLQLGVVCGAYLGLRRDFHSSAWILAALLSPIEWMTSAPAGLYAGALVLVFLALRPITSKLERQWNLGKSLLCAAGALLHPLAMAAYLFVTRPGSIALDAILATSITGALLAGVASIPIGIVLARMERALDRRRDLDGVLD